jgi:threonine dehydrogenase-like Zn-dependent dehydrogenase
MKQIIMTGPGKSTIREVPDLHANDDQVLIKQIYIGVCMSEHQNWKDAKAGDALGHEPLGQIVEAGKNVSGFAFGDYVSGLWGSCLPGSGGMVEYAVADPRKDTVVKLPGHIRHEDIILEPLACMMSAVSKIRCSMPGTKVCVVGCGYMGCGVISLLKLRGMHVVGVDLRKESLADAKRYGADEVYLADEILVHYSNGSFEFVTEWGETNESLDLAINLVKQCGQLCIGAYHTGGKRLVDVQQLNLKAIDCLSVHPREYDLSAAGARNAVQLLASGSWKFVNLPVKIYPMNKFDLAHEEIESKYGKYMKAIIDMTKVDGEAYII